MLNIVRRKWKKFVALKEAKKASGGQHRQKEAYRRGKLAAKGTVHNECSALPIEKLVTSEMSNGVYIEQFRSSRRGRYRRAIYSTSLSEPTSS